METEIVVLGNNTDWCKYSWNDWNTIHGLKFLNTFLPCGNKGIVNRLAKIHFSRGLNRKIKLPMKRIWYPYFSKFISSDKNASVICVIYDWNVLGNDINFLSYLRRHYPKMKLAYLFTNIAAKSGAANHNMIDKLKEIYDVVYAFDPEDSKKYGFSYAPLVYSMNNLAAGNKVNRVFYVGRAKDRYPMLIRVYEALSKLNIGRLFYIANYSGERKYEDDIHYNEMISYEECLRNIQQSSCLLDVIQGESEGFTIKVCEAVYYDKLLITTNKNVIGMPFYDERFIRVISDENDIDEEFFRNGDRVKYSADGKAYFAVQTFVNKLRKDLD